MITKVGKKIIKKLLSFIDLIYKTTLLWFLWEYVACLPFLWQKPISRCVEIERGFFLYDLVAFSEFQETITSQKK